MCEEVVVRVPSRNKSVSTEVNQVQLPTHVCLKSPAAIKAAMPVTVLKAAADHPAMTAAGADDTAQAILRRIEAEGETGRPATL